MKNYYSILGISFDSDVMTIKKTYRQLALKYHPDKNKSIDAHDKFIEITEAYEILRNESTKKEYDLLFYKFYVQNEELSKLTTKLNTMSSAISELRKKEPLFFKTKWINQINDLIDQHNTQLDIQKHISGLSEIEKKERYSDHLNKWTEENQLLQPKKSFAKFDEPNITVKQRKLNDQISNIDHQISEISRRISAATSS